MNKTMSSPSEKSKVGKIYELIGFIAGVIVLGIAIAAFTYNHPIYLEVIGIAALIAGISCLGATNKPWVFAIVWAAMGISYIAGCAIWPNLIH